MSEEFCGYCNGSGRKEECEKCYGKGWVPDPSDGGTMTCPQCDGDAAEECNKCDGTGEPTNETGNARPGGE